MFSPTFIRTMVQVRSVMRDKNVSVDIARSVLDAVITMEKERILSEVEHKLNNGAIDLKSRLDTYIF